MPSKFGGVEVEEKPSGGSKFGGVAVDDHPDTRGTERLPGGVAPGVSKPGLPPEENREFQGDSYGSELLVPSHNFATDGMSRVGSGVAAIANNRKARGASDIIRGVGEVSSPVTTAMGLMNPVMGARAIAGGAAGEYLGRGAAGLFGAGVDAKDATGDVSGLIGSGVGISPKTVPFVKGAIKAAPGALRDNFHVPLTLHNLMTSRIPVPAALGALAGHAVGHPVAGGVAGTVAGAIPAIVRGGIRASASEPWAPRGPFPDAPDAASPERKLLGAGPILTEPPADGSFVRGVPAMAHPPNPARAIAAAPRTLVTEPPAPVDGSYVRGVPAMNQPPNPARAIAAAPRVIEMPAAADASYVRGTPAEDGFAVPRESEILSGPLTPPEAKLPKTTASNGSLTHSDNTGIAPPSRSNARFDANGKRLWPGERK